MININNKLDFHANQDKRLRAQKVQLILVLITYGLM